MTRLRSNWLTQLCLLATAFACGSSKNDGGVRSDSITAVGGDNGSSLGGNGYSNGGSTAGVIGNGGVNNIAGNGSSDSQGGNGSGTGSTGSF